MEDLKRNNTVHVALRISTSYFNIIRLAHLEAFILSMYAST